QELRIVTTVVRETRRDALRTSRRAILLLRVVRGGRQNRVVPVKVDRVEAVARRDHLLVDLLARPYADDSVLAVRIDRPRHVQNSIRRNLRYEDLASPAVLHGPDHHVDAFL